MVRSESPDFQYISEPIDWIEDHEYDEADDPVDQDAFLARRYHRRLMQATVDFRNF